MSIQLINVKSQIERTRCIVHSENVKMVINGDKFTLHCCCEPFKEDSLKKVRGFLATEAKRAITESLNKAFKQFR